MWDAATAAVHRGKFIALTTDIEKIKNNQSIHLKKLEEKNNKEGMKYMYMYNWFMLL